VKISRKSLAYTPDAEVVPNDDSGSETLPSNPSSSCHNSDHFDETNGAKDIEVLSSATCSVLDSQGSKPNAPDNLNTPNDQPLHITINHNSKNNTIEGEMLQPPLPSVLQMHAVAELVTVNT
jgi:hypothetical protein